MTTIRTLITSALLGSLLLFACSGGDSDDRTDTSHPPAE